MSRILNVASVAAVGMTAATMLVLAEPGFASDLGADANLPAFSLPGADAPVAAETADLPTEPAAPVDAIEQIVEDSIVEPEVEELTAASLAELVAATPRPAKLDAELRCLAGAVYFESRGESLAGQLAERRRLNRMAERDVGDLHRICAALRGRERDRPRAVVEGCRRRRRPSPRPRSSSPRHTRRQAQLRAAT